MWRRCLPFRTLFDTKAPARSHSNEGIGRISSASAFQLSKKCHLSGQSIDGRSLLVVLHVSVLRGWSSSTVALDRREPYVSEQRTDRLMQNSDKVPEYTSMPPASRLVRCPVPSKHHIHSTHLTQPIDCIPEGIRSFSLTRSDLYSTVGRIPTRNP